MSDIVVPSWRPSQEKPAVSGRMLAVAGGLLGLVALGAAATWGISRMGPRQVPVIEADPRPLKTRPDQPGGMVVPNQDQLVLEGATQRRAADRNRNSVAQLDTGPEAPALDLLRQHIGPPGPGQPQRQAQALASVPAPMPAGAAPSNPAPAAVAATASSLGGPVPALAPPASIKVVASIPAADPGALPGPVPGGRAHAQFGALNSEESARAEWDRILRRVPELAAFQPRIIRLERDGQPALFRLRAAGLPDAAAAKALCDAVRLRGVTACVPSGGNGGGA